jgi:hypothetical protein
VVAPERPGASPFSSQSADRRPPVRYAAPPPTGAPTTRRPRPWPAPASRGREAPSCRNRSVRPPRRAIVLRAPGLRRTRSLHQSPGEGIFGFSRGGIASLVCAVFCSSRKGPVRAGPQPSGWKPPSFRWGSGVTPVIVPAASGPGAQRPGGQGPGHPCGAGDRHPAARGHGHRRPGHPVAEHRLPRVAVRSARTA